MGKQSKQKSSSQPQTTNPHRTEWVRRHITAKLVEDAHPGSGVGSDGINALVSRDRKGRPVIWASHLEGLLREAARSLHNEEEVKRLFGEQGQARQRMVLTSLYAEQAKPSRVWRSTARASFDNRAPQDDTLRAIEFVPAGTVFTGQVELPAKDLLTLERLLKEVDAIGHGRASGAGRVEWGELTDAETTAAILTAKSRVLLLLRNLDPLCIATTATPGNIIPTLSFVPGRTLLGALAGWLIAEGRKDAAKLLVDGQVAVSDALPIQSGDFELARSPSKLEVLPAPLALQSAKPSGATGAVPWWAQQTAPVHRVNAAQLRDKARQEDAAKKDAQPKLKRPEPDLFVQRYDGGTWTTYRPETRVRLRNGRPDPKQEDPSLFAVEQIAEGTLFLAELRGGSSDLEDIQSALRPVLESNRWLRIGRAGVPVVVERVSPGDPLPAPKRGHAPPPPANKGPAYVTLTSDLLFRDKQLRWQTVLTAEDFVDLPGWPRTDILVSPEFQEATTVHGWNGTARLWRLPAAGIRRGSVFKVAGAGVQELIKAAAAGLWLGERTHEGFGRFRIDQTLPGVTKETDQESGKTILFKSATLDDDPDDALAAQTEEWCEQHKELAKKTETESSPRPSMSQWKDLVTDLDAEKPDALQSRMDPKTAGAAGWNDPDANAVLKKLDALKIPVERKAHARMFVRWLRLKARNNKGVA